MTVPTYGTNAGNGMPVPQLTSQPLGTQISNWVNQSVQGIPALQPNNQPLNPGMGGPIHGQQVHTGVTDAVPGGAPPVALPPGAVPPVPVNTQFPINPDSDPRQKPDKLFGGQEPFQPTNPNRFASIYPMVQHLMQRRGYPFRTAPSQAAPLHNAVMPNPTPVY